MDLKGDTVSGSFYNDSPLITTLIFGVNRCSRKIVPKYGGQIGMYRYGRLTQYGMKTTCE